LRNRTELQLSALLEYMLMILIDSIARNDDNVVVAATSFLYFFYDDDDDDATETLSPSTFLGARRAAV